MSVVLSATKANSEPQLCLQRDCLAELSMHHAPRARKRNFVQKVAGQGALIIGQEIGPLWDFCAPISIIVEL